MASGYPRSGRSRSRGRALSTRGCRWQSGAMRCQFPSYYGYHFPPEIISNAVLLYHRFYLSFRDVEICSPSGASPSRTKPSGSGVRPSGSPTPGSCGAPRPAGRHVVPGRSLRHDQRPAPVSMARVDQDGDVIGILVQSRRDQQAARRFFRKLLTDQGRAPRQLITDKLRRGAPHRDAVGGVQHAAAREQSHGSVASTDAAT